MKCHCSGENVSRPSERKLKIASASWCKELCDLGGSEDRCADTERISQMGKRCGLGVETSCLALSHAESEARRTDLASQSIDVAGRSSEHLLQSYSHLVEKLDGPRAGRSPNSAFGWCGCALWAKEGGNFDSLGHTELFEAWAWSR